MKLIYIYREIDKKQKRNFFDPSRRNFKKLWWWQQLWQQPPWQQQPLQQQPLQQQPPLHGQNSQADSPNTQQRVKKQKLQVKFNELTNQRKVLLDSGYLVSSVAVTTLDEKVLSVSNKLLSIDDTPDNTQ